MNSRYSKWSGVIALIIVLSLLLAACGEEEPEVVEKEVTRVVQETVVETVVEKETVIETVVEQETVLQTVVQKETVIETVVEEVVVTATAEPEMGPQVGGKLVYAAVREVESLDPTRFTGSFIGQYLGAALVDLSPEGEFVPWLAESWEISEDGLTWDFKLREDIKFHDGAPLTAQDYAWTFNRAIDPEIASTSGSFLGALDSAEAVDDYTLRLNLNTPSFPLLYSLTDSGYMMPLRQEVVEQWGDEYGRHPISVGPMKFKEWVTGEKIVFERNPDYNWGPDYAHKGPWYIGEIEFRFIPEVATVVAGLETGEIDYASLDARDVKRVMDTGQFQLFDTVIPGLRPAMFPNLTVPPFDDVRVRQALNLAVNKEALINAIELGNAEPQYGPISPTVIGYWPGVEEIGYRYDLERAKALMAEAGWTDSDGDGVLDKDGQPFKFTIKVATMLESWVRAAEMLQQQYKELGLDLDLVTLETGLWVAECVGGNCELGIIGFDWGEADILFLGFHSSMIGVWNTLFLADPELDALLEATRTTMDPEERQAVVDEVQKYIVEQAYVVPLYASKQYEVLSNRVVGGFVSPVTTELYMADAYIVEK